MNNEIEEILDNLKKHNALADEEDTYLLHYITNLQKENKKLNEIIETLKETNKLLINQKYKLEYELDMLDNKRDKAIEYIQREFCQVNKETKEIECWHERVEPILDILQGEDNE